jgi:predicted N-acetyltransferase YhbS
VSGQAEDEVRLALATEQRLFPDACLVPDRTTATSKVLMVRPTSRPLPASRHVQLAHVHTVQAWENYTAARVAVEAGFGVAEDRARGMVHALRRRGRNLGLDVFLCIDDGQPVGAVGRLRLPQPYRAWARLQEVDVFPGWRGRGYGDAVLAAILERLADEDAAMAVVAADEDDWPLHWYRRRGWRDVARVPRTR